MNFPVRTLATIRRANETYAEAMVRVMGRQHMTVEQIEKALRSDGYIKPDDPPSGEYISFTVLTHEDFICVKAGLFRVRDRA